MVLRIHEDEKYKALSQRRCVVQIFITNIQEIYIPNLLHYMISLFKRSEVI